MPRCLCTLRIILGGAGPVAAKAILESRGALVAKDLRRLSVGGGGGEDCVA